MGRLSQYLERRALQTAIPGEREAPSFPKGQGSGQSTKPGAGEGLVGGKKILLTSYCPFLVPAICV